MKLRGYKGTRDGIKQSKPKRQATVEAEPVQRREREQDITATASWIITVVSRTILRNLRWVRSESSRGLARINSDSRRGYFAGVRIACLIVLRLIYYRGDCELVVIFA